SADAVGGGLVSSLARPGGNVTGLSLLLAETSVKRLQLLKEAVPKVTRVAVLWDPATPFHRAMLKEIDAAAPSLKLQPLPVLREGPRRSRQRASGDRARSRGRRVREPRPLPQCPPRASRLHLKEPPAIDVPEHGVGHGWRPHVVQPRFLRDVSLGGH